MDKQVEKVGRDLSGHLLAYGTEARESYYKWNQA